MADAYSPHPPRRLAGRDVFPIGFGSMLLAHPGRPDEAAAIRTIHAALEMGIRTIDTAINYCLDEHELGFNEHLVSLALSTWSGNRDEVIVVVKGGNLRTAELPYVQDARPEVLRSCCETSLRSLGTDRIDLYLLHAVDPNVPLEDSLGALADLQREGKIVHLGIGNVGRRQLAQAMKVIDVTAVQNQLSPWVRSSLPLMRMCAEHSITFMAWSPLGRTRASQLGREHPAFAQAAVSLGVSPQQVALAWALEQSPVVLPIPGATRPATIIDSAGAATLRLDASTLALLDREDGFAG